MTLEEIQKAFPIGSVVINPTHYARNSPGRVLKHNRFSGYSRYDQYYVCWETGRSSWPEYLELIKELSPLEQSISDYIAAEKRELGINA